MDDLEVGTSEVGSEVDPLEVNSEVSPSDVEVSKVDVWNKQFLTHFKAITIAIMAEADILLEEYEEHETQGLLSSFDKIRHAHRFMGDDASPVMFALCSPVLEKVGVLGQPSGTVVHCNKGLQLKAPEDK